MGRAYDLYCADPTTPHRALAGKATTMDHDWRLRVQHGAARKLINLGLILSFPLQQWATADCWETHYVLTDAGFGVLWGEKPRKGYLKKARTK